MKKVLVTGASGYIGSVLVPKLLASGYEVRAIDRFFFGDDNLALHPQLELIKEDSRKLSSVHFENVHAVIDLVAISNDPTAEEFSKETWEINHQSRLATAKLAKETGVQRYILASSASVYGHKDELASETDTLNPQTIYAKANMKAETDILPLAGLEFCVTAIRQATIFGLSPRMRFDLAVNGMTYGAFANQELPLMRDGSQFRPLLHIDDATDFMIHLLGCSVESINGELFNVGSAQNNIQIRNLGEIVAEYIANTIGKPVKIEWYGDPDHRNYRLDCTKLESQLNWKAKRTVLDGVSEIVEALNCGIINKELPTITLEWYRELIKWQKIIHRVEMYGGILDIE